MRVRVKDTEPLLVGLPDGAQGLQKSSTIPSKSVLIKAVGHGYIAGNGISSTAEQSRIFIRKRLLSFTQEAFRYFSGQ